MQVPQPSSPLLVSNDPLLGLGLSQAVEEQLNLAQNQPHINAVPSSSAATQPHTDMAIHPSSTSSVSMTSLASVPAPALGQGERIRRPFVPTLGDEVAVSSGDIVDVQQVFDDGWAYVAVQREGSNEPSVGLIPVDCFREAGEELPAFLAAKRVSSYKGPVQAQ